MPAVGYPDLCPGGPPPPQLHLVPEITWNVSSSVEESEKPQAGTGMAKKQGLLWKGAVGPELKDSLRCKESFICVCNFCVFKSLFFMVIYSAGSYKTYMYLFIHGSLKKTLTFE